MQVRALAKINLNLRVLGRNPSSGYHDLETWMVPVSLADDLRIERTHAPGVQLTCSDPDLDSGSGNLAWRAAEAFLRASRLDGGVAIELHKHIPHGAGLGGGSSDAASVLRTLNQRADAPLDDDALHAIAVSLGADVPFFLRGSACLARGRGEILESRPLPRPLDLLLLKPPFGVSTAWAYGQWGQPDGVPAAWTAPQLLEGIEIVNDLERPVFAKYLVLPALKQWLLEHSLVAAAAMSGSGSCLFAVLRDPRGADQLATDARAEFGDTLWTASCTTA
ncbi:MAG: 4-(cytidine 5'-diphospho)-2-C-methyl-D-erythritol kinase [Chthoniobacterales bacterium]